VKLADIKYVYVRSRGDRERGFKIVSFYLLATSLVAGNAHRGSAGQVIRLEDAPKLLAYRGEKQVARQALEYMRSHAEV
jgi:hypothetical protein